MKDRKVLVDTSAWILSFRGKGHEDLKTCLKEAIDANRAVVTPLIILELLQGCRTKKEYENLRLKLESLENCTLSESGWERLYSFGFSLRRKGLTLPTIDILIAFLATENDYILLHHDRHFRMIAEKSALRVIDFLDKE